MLETPAITSHDDASASKPEFERLGHFYSSNTRPLWSAEGDIDRLGPAPISKVNSIFAGIACAVFAWFIIDYIDPGRRSFAWLMSFVFGGVTAALPIMAGRANARKGSWLEWDSSTTTLRLPRQDLELAATDVSRIQLVFFQDWQSANHARGAFSSELQLVDRHGRTRLICTAIGGRQLRPTAVELGRILEADVIEATETIKDSFRVETIGHDQESKQNAELSS